MDKQYFTLQELLNVPGMYTTVQGNRKLANREGWTKKKCEQGKGFEYHLASLPIETQAYLRATSIEQSTDACVVAAKSATH